MSDVAVTRTASDLPSPHPISLDTLLADGISAAEAVRLALRTHPDVLAGIAAVDLAGAERYQAGRLKNPTVESHVGFALEEHHDPDLLIGVSFDLLDVIYRPYRRATASSALEAARLRMHESLLVLSGQVQLAYLDLQAAEASVGLRRQVVQSQEAAFLVADRMHEAGTLRKVDHHRIRLGLEQARTDLETAQSARFVARERLAQWTGLSGDQEWHVDALPDTLSVPPSDEALVEEALDNSLALAVRRQDLETLALDLRATNASALVPALQVGAEAQREGSWDAGPSIALPLPVFDRGKGRRDAATARLRGAQADYLRRAAEVQTRARVLGDALRMSHSQVERHRTLLIPLAGEVTSESLRLYNAMQIGVFELLAAREQEIRAGVAAIEATRAYLAARIRVDLLRQGVLLDLPSASPVAAPAATTVNLH